jgi:hypothetical protein
LLVGNGGRYLVDAIVELVINPIIHFVNLLTEGFGIKVPLGMFLIEEFVKSRIEDANDLARLVVDYYKSGRLRKTNCLKLLIPKYRNSVSVLVIWVRPKIQLLASFEPIQGVNSRIKPPSFGSQIGVSRIDEGHNVLQPLELMEQPGTTAVRGDLR